MSGVGSTNAMKKGSGNNLFLAYSEEDMQGYLNSAYTGCIVKYTGPSTRTAVPRGRKLSLGDAQNLVVDLTKNFTYSSVSYKSREWNIGIEIENSDNTKTNQCIMNIKIDSKTGIIGSGNNDIQALIYSEYTPYSSLYGKNINEISVKFLAVTSVNVYRDVVVNWPITYGKNGWQSDCFNDLGKITLWGYGETVLAYQNQNNIDYWGSGDVIYTEPYVVNELYKVVYGNGQYYFEEFYYISENVTTATVEDVAPGKTFYDFTGTKQTGTGIKINPYLAADVSTFTSFPKGSFIKWLGPDATLLSDGTKLYKGSIYQGVDEDGDTNAYVLLLTLTNPGTAADLAQGKQLIDGEGKVVEGAAAFSFGDYSVKVVDYDGTVLMEKKGNTGDVIDLPTAPTHDKLVFQGWSASVAVSDNKVTIADNDIMVGAVYTTASEQNEFDITLTEVTGLSVTLNIDGTKDWGDGTSDTTTTHTYTAYGDYTIKCNGTITKNVFGSTDSAPNYYCKKARLVTNISTNAFYDCFSLNSITLSNVVTRVGTTAFYNCMSLTNVIIPNSVISVGTSAFQNCHSLNRILIPNSITNIENSIFDSCYSLDNIILPDSVTVIGNGAFAYCYSLTNIILPNSITQIKDYAFQGCYSLIKYDFSQCSSVPTLSNVNVFNNINKICKIIVPDSLYDEWIAASQWIGYSIYIYKASEEVTQ